MATYQDWNKAIYNFYFKDTDTIRSRTFSVDEGAINVIGREINVNNNATIDFCKCVIDKLQENEKIKIPKEVDNYDLIPSETAVLAFFIYVASIMGKYPKYRSSAYWLMIEGDTRKSFIEEENIGKKGLSVPLNSRENLQILFVDFAKKISEKFKIDYRFKNYFKRAYVGLPISQAMITERDYCKLTQKFAKIKNESEIDSWNIGKDKDFSSIMKKIYGEEESKNLIIKKIKDLYSTWDHNVIELDENSFKRYRKFINLLYGYNYSKKLDRFEYFNTADIRDDYDDIELSDGKLIKQDNSKYYEGISIKENDISLKEKLEQVKNPSGLKVGRDSKNYIKLKYIESENRFVEQIAIDGIKVGDKFSIIATGEFFEENSEKIVDIIDDDLECSEVSKEHNLWLLHDKKAENYDGEIVVFNRKDKILLKKGLKTNDRNTWIENAPPKIESIVPIKIQKENSEEKKGFSEGTIDLNNEKSLNKKGCYEILSDNAENKIGSYNIIPIGKVEANRFEEFPEIYHVISNDKIERSSDKNAENPIVFGAYIDNISPDYNKHILINNKKLSYILDILNKHTNKKKYKIPDSINETLETITKYCNSSNKQNIKKYLEENDKIDNYICIYLNRMKEVINE